MKTYLKVIIFVAVVVIMAIIVGLFTRGSSNRYGDNSTLSGGLNVQASNVGDTLTVGTTTLKFTVSSGAGNLYTGGGLTYGGGVFATTSSSSATLLAGSLVGFQLLSFSLPVGAVTITLPASTTMSSTYLPNVGDTDDIYLYNASTTAAQDITVAGGTGVILQLATSTAKVFANTVQKLELIRKPNTDIQAIFY